MGLRCVAPVENEGDRCHRSHRYTLTTIDRFRATVTPPRHTAAVTTPEPGVGTAAGTGFKADGTPDVFNVASVEKVFASDGELSDRRKARKAKFEQYHEAAYAPKTRQGYNGSVRKFCAFCVEDKDDIKPAFPTTPEVLIEWVCDLGLHQDPKTGRHYQPSYIAKMVAAVGKWHTSHGLSNPATDEVLRFIKHGYAHVQGRNPARADPILRALLLQLVDTTHAPTVLARRTAAMLLLLTDDEEQLGPRRLERFCSWNQLEWPKTDDGPALLTLEYEGGPDRVEIVRHDDPRLDPVQALRDLYEWSEGTDPVFPNPKGKPIGAGGISRAGDQWCAVAGVVRAKGHWAVGDENRERLMSCVFAQTDIQVRDRCQFCVQWFGANRRSEVAAYRWRDIHAVEDDTSLLKFEVTRSKRDRKGDGQVRLIAAQPEPRIDPHRVIAEWKARSEVILGRPVRPSDPVLFRLDRNAGPRSDPKPMSGDAINNRVKAAVAAAGLQGRYTSHSMRGGCATNAFLDGFEMEEVQDHLGHADSRSTKLYRSDAARRGYRNPTRRPADSEEAAAERIAAAVVAKLGSHLNREDGREEPLRELVERLTDEELRAVDE